MQDKRVCKFGGHGVDIMLKHVENTAQVYWTIGHDSYVIVSSAIGAFVTRQGERVDLLCVNGIGEIRWRVTAGDIPPPGHDPVGHDQVDELSAVRYFDLTLYAGTTNGAADNPFILPFDELAWRPLGPAGDPRCRMVATAKAQGQDVHFHIDAYCAEHGVGRIADLLRIMDNGNTFETVEIDDRQYVITILPFYK